MKRLFFPAIVACAMALPLISTATDPPANPQGEPFRDIYRVLMSPRCKNCHPSDDTPRIGDQGMRHRMNVSRKSPESGLPCTTCHRETNAPFLHGPPGVHDWKMPPREFPMVFDGKSPRELCAALKDPAFNKNRSLHELEEHMTSDPLVLWGWSPGPGRTLPPIPQPEFAAKVRAWIAAGAPCP